MGKENLEYYAPNRVRMKLQIECSLRTPNRQKHKGPSAYQRMAFGLQTPAVVMAQHREREWSANIPENGKCSEKRLRFLF
jgi:hypothetical protein